MKEPTILNDDAPKILVEVDNLVKYYPVRAGLLRRVVNPIKAVDWARFNILEGESFGVVGESCLVKTTVGPPLLLPITPTRRPLYLSW